MPPKTKRPPTRKSSVAAHNRRNVGSREQASSSTPNVPIAAKQQQTAAAKEREQLKTVMLPPTVQMSIQPQIIAPTPNQPAPQQSPATPRLQVTESQMQQNTVQSPEVSAAPPRMEPPPAAAIMRKPPRNLERDITVDEGENSEKRKKTDIINSWIGLVLANGVEGLKKEYRDSANEAPMDRATAFADNPTRNRYKNIPCCDTTRVKYPDDPHYYLHANLVSSGPNPRRFICTQAPLASTIEEFWKMVIVSGLEFIVMLCEVVEQGKPKSAAYFPTKNGEVMKIGKLCSITRESSVDLDKNLTMSTFRVAKVGDTAVALTVKHIHWHQWPDHGVPDNFLSPFRLLTVFKGCQKPIVVHCSAGVGRTGTLVLILIILESLRSPEFLGVPRLLTKLREERFKAIQTEMQYLYVHRCILEYLVLKKYDCPKDQYEKFAKEYYIAATQLDKGGEGK